MKILTKSVAIVVLSTAMGLTSLTSAGAMTVPLVKHTQVSDAHDVQYRHHAPRRGWYNGHRGYRSYHRGYRRYSDGYWYPLAAFGAGAIIGGALSTQTRSYPGSNSHIRWCLERYRSYRASDNTYVPRAGVRVQCHSPYH